MRADSRPALFFATCCLKTEFCDGVDQLSERLAVLVMYEDEVLDDTEKC